MREGYRKLSDVKTLSPVLPHKSQKLFFSLSILMRFCASKEEPMATENKCTMVVCNDVKKTEFSEDVKN